MSRKLGNSLVEQVILCGVEPGGVLDPLVGGAAAGSGEEQRWIPQLLATYSVNACSFHSATSYTLQANYPPTQAGSDPEVNPDLAEETVPLKYPHPLKESPTRNAVSLCYPEGYKLRDSDPGDSLDSFVLTDIHGDYSYAVSCTFHVELLVEDLLSGSKRVLSLDRHPVTSSVTSPAGPEKRSRRVGHTECIRRVYLPVTVCIISKHALLVNFKRIASELMHLCKQADTIQQCKNVLKEPAFKLCLIPVPSPGKLSVRFTWRSQTHLIKGADKMDGRLSNQYVHHPFIYFNDYVLGAILSAILTNEKVIFISSKSAVLTDVIESFIKLIEPFTWISPYVPVAPFGTSDLIECPGSIIAGFHACHLADLREKLDRQEADTRVRQARLAEQQEDRVATLLVNVEYGYIVRRTAETPQIPEKYLTPCIKAVRQLVLNNERATEGQPISFSMEEEAQRKHAFYSDISKCIRSSLQSMMLNMFEGFHQFWNKEKTNFQSHNFVDSVKDPDDKEFYSRMIATPAFSQFLNYLTSSHSTGRFKQILLHNTATRKASLRVRQQISVDERLDASRDQRERKVFHIPQYTYTGTDSHLRTCIEEIERAVDEKSPVTRDNLLLIKADMHQALQEHIAALSTLKDVSDSRLVPPERVQTLVVRIGDSLSADTRHADLLKWVQARQRSHSGDSGKKVNQIQNVNFTKPLDKNEFMAQIKALNVTTYEDIITNLFVLLARGATGQMLVDPTVLNQIIQSFKDEEANLSEVAQALSDATQKNGTSMKLREQERMVKVSQPNTRTSEGFGRVVITSRQLLLMKRTRNVDDTQARHICHLKDISLGEISTFTNPLTKVITAWIPYQASPAPTDRKTFQVSAHHDQLPILKELVAAAYTVEREKEYGIRQKAAENAILLSSVLSVKHVLQERLGIRRKDIIEHLRIFKDDIVPEDVQVHPGIKASLRPVNSRETVESIIIVYEKPISIWCGIANLICVFSGVTNSTEEYIKLENEHAHVLQLLENGSSYVMAITDKRNEIFVVSKEKLAVERELYGHTSQVVCMRIKGRTLVSLTFAGEVITWCSVMLHQKRRILLEHSLRAFSFVITQDDRIAVCETMVPKAGGGGGLALHDFNGKFLELKVKSPNENGSLIKTCFIDSHGQIWCGENHIGDLYRVTRDDVVNRLSLPNKGITSIVQYSHSIWATTRCGSIEVLDVETFAPLKTLRSRTSRGLQDSSPISAIAVSENYVITGTRSPDGSIHIWSPAMLESEETPSDGRRRAQPFRNFQQQFSVDEFEASPAASPTTEQIPR